MFKMLNKARGQSTLEYAILIIIVVGALLTIQQYVKRGIQGRFKSAADDIGEHAEVTARLRIHPAEDLLPVDAEAVLIGQLDLHTGDTRKLGHDTLDLRLDRTRLIESEAANHAVVPLGKRSFVVVAEAEVKRQAGVHLPVVVDKSGVVVVPQRRVEVLVHSPALRIPQQE